MAARKTTDLTALTAPTANTLVAAVDLTEALASNQNKKLTLNDLTKGLSAATTSAAGVVQLSTSTSSTSTSLAATSSAVKSAYDLAAAALPLSGGTMTGAIAFAGAQPTATTSTAGIVQLSSSTSSTSTTLAATPSAVKTAYDLAAAAMVNPLYYRLNSTLAGSNVSTAQSILGVGVSLTANTVYEFEGMFALSKTTGTTSHTISFGFGGTATINNIAFQVNTAIAPSGLTTGGTASLYEFQTAAGGVVDAAQSTAGMHFMAFVKGTVSINGAGTLIPQYTLSAAPGGAYSTIQSSYFKLATLGAAGANTSIGTWA